MPPMFFEDYNSETRLSTLARTVTETDLVNFVGLAGFYEPLFMDKEYLQRESPYKGGRLIPGALTYSLSEGLIIQTGALHGTGIAFLGLDLKITRPVYVGDTIRVEVETIEARPSTRPDRGIVITMHHVYNQRDEEVMTCKVTRLVRRREPAA